MYKERHGRLDKQLEERRKMSTKETANRGEAEEECTRQWEGRKRDDWKGGIERKEKDT